MKNELHIGYEAKRIFHNRSGLGNYGRNLLQSLSDFQPQNRYTLFNPGAGQLSFSPPGTTEVRAPYKQPWMRNIWRQKMVSVHARQLGVEVFHGLSQELPGGLKKQGIASVVSIHDLIFLRYPKLYKWIDRKVYRKKVELACKRADRIVAISHQTKLDLMEFLQIPQERISVIYQSCDPRFAKLLSEADRQAILQDYNLPEDYMLFVGTLEERKNLKGILEALLLHPVPTVLVGRKTKYWQKLWSQKRYQKLRDIVYLPVVENNDHLVAFYQGARTFIYPSFFEGFGIPLLEALYSDVPVITSNRSSLPEVTGEAGIHVDLDDPKALAIAIGSLWEDESRRAELIAAGRIQRQKFAPEKLAGEWQELYASLK